MLYKWRQLVMSWTWKVSQLLQQEQQTQTIAGTDLSTALQADPKVNEIIQFLCDNTLLHDHTKTKKVAALAQSFALIDEVCNRVYR